MTTTMDIALLIFRLVVGLTLAGHGTQKLFGWFGGPGFIRLQQAFGAMGYKPAWLWISLAIVGEIGGGLSFALGFLTPLGAAGILGAMVMASKSHWKNGFFAQNGGYEYTLVLVAASIAIGLIGPGRYALDTLFNISLPEVLLFILLAVAALVVDIVGMLLTSRATIPHHESSSRA